MQNLSLQLTGKVKIATCCGYGTKFENTFGADCAVIPSPSKAADGASLSMFFDGFCGAELGSIGDGIVAATICCK